MDSDKRKILKPIGWEDSWEVDFSKVKKVSDSNVVTNLIVLTLLSIFSQSSEVLSFLGNLLPDITLPDFPKFCKLCDKLKNTRRVLMKNKRKQAALVEFYETPFLNRSEPVTASVPICEHEPETKRLRLQTETLE